MKERDILEGWNILWPLLHISGGQDPLKPHDPCPGIPSIISVSPHLIPSSSLPFLPSVLSHPFTLPSSISVPPSPPKNIYRGSLSSHREPNAFLCVSANLCSGAVSEPGLRVTGQQFGPRCVRSWITGSTIWADAGQQFGSSCVGSLVSVTDLASGPFFCSVARATQIWTVNEASEEDFSYSCIISGIRE